ncbi:hypothetical protein VPHK367G1_0084 [Vibrio phage K367 g1]
MQYVICNMLKYPQNTKSVSSVSSRVIANYTEVI